MRSPRRTYGFTLLELLITITLLGLLAAMVWPGFLAMQRASELDESVRRLRSVIGLCRAQAMHQSRSYRIDVLTDGSIQVRRQLDALLAPEVFVLVEADWAVEPLFEHVWIEAVRALPGGPAPLTDDESIDDLELVELDDPVAVTEMEGDLRVTFRPDGTSESISWIVRDEDGRGVELILDGRIGRIASVSVARSASDALDRPPRLPDPEPEPTEAELLAEIEP